MNLVCKNRIHVSVAGEQITPAALDGNPQEGINIIHGIHKHNGFALGFLENILRDHNKLKEFQIQAERDGTHQPECVYCPLNSLALTAIGLRPEAEDKCFNRKVLKCNKTACMTENNLPTHLVEEAYLKGCYQHCAALIYIKNVLLLGKNRPGMLHHISEQAYNHLLRHDTIMKERSDDSNGFDSEGHGIQSVGTIHERKDTKEEGKYEAEVKEDEEGKVEAEIKYEKGEEEMSNMMQELDNLVDGAKKSN